MISKIDTLKTALEIAEVLHENKISIDKIQVVFDEAKKLIESSTIPANPKTLYEWDKLVLQKSDGAPRL